MNASKLNTPPQQIMALKSFLLWELVINKEGAPKEGAAGKGLWGIQS